MDRQLRLQQQHAARSVGEDGHALLQRLQADVQLLEPALQALQRLALVRGERDGPALLADGGGGARLEGDLRGPGLPLRQPALRAARGHHEGRLHRAEERGQGGLEARRGVPGDHRAPRPGQPPGGPRLDRPEPRGHRRPGDAAGGRGALQLRGAGPGSAGGLPPVLRAAPRGGRLVQRRRPGRPSGQPAPGPGHLRRRRLPPGPRGRLGLPGRRARPLRALHRRRHQGALPRGLRRRRQRRHLRRPVGAGRVRRFRTGRGGRAGGGPGRGRGRRLIRRFRTGRQRRCGGRRRGRRQGRLERGRQGGRERRGGGRGAGRELPESGRGLRLRHAGATGRLRLGGPARAGPAGGPSPPGPALTLAGGQGRRRCCGRRRALPRR